MVMSAADADRMRCPFVKQASGNWALFLIEGKHVEWGHTPHSTVVKAIIKGEAVDVGGVTG